MTNDERFIRVAIEQSQIAVKSGNYPYGAILVHKEEILIGAFNTSLTTRDISAHAELSVLREAAIKYEIPFLQECTLYSSCEPCVMCSGAIYWSGIYRIVYSCSSELDARLSNMPFAIPCRDILKVQDGHSIEIVGPLLEHESAKVLVEYWKEFPQNTNENFGLSR